MELRQLEYLVAVAEEASFTRPPQRLHVAQPGVSAQIRRLERELGQELLDRAGRRAPDGGRGGGAPYARAALAAVARARHAVDDLAGLVQGRVGDRDDDVVRRADVPTCWRLPRGPSRRGDHADRGNTDVLVAGLRDGTLDLALVGLPARRRRGIETQVVTDEALVAAVGPATRSPGATAIACARCATAR